MCVKSVNMGLCAEVRLYISSMKNEAKRGLSLLIDLRASAAFPGGEPDVPSIKVYYSKSVIEDRHHFWIANDGHTPEFYQTVLFNLGQRIVFYEQAPWLDVSPHAPESYHPGLVPHKVLGVDPNAVAEQIADRINNAMAR